MVVNIIQELVTLGLSEYDAKAYVALITCGESMTAYEIAKSSAIPTSKIYEVMGRLIDREIAQPIESNGSRRYTAIDPDEFVARHRARTESTLDRVGSRLASLKGESHAAMIWNLNDYDLLIDKARRMIDDASGEILISLWKDEMRMLHPSLERAVKRKVRTAVVHFGEHEQTVGMLFPHPIADTIYAEKGGRGFAMVADTQCALIGTIRENGQVEGGWSSSYGFVTLAEDYIKHDIYIMKIVSRYERELISRFGEGYALLRDVFSDKERKKS
jgi:sugar-specific transcriptional regulator TrmB